MRLEQRNLLFAVEPFRDLNFLHHRLDAQLAAALGLALGGFLLVGFKHLLAIPRADAAVMILVLVWTVFGNLIHAVAAGVVLASVLFMKQASDLAEAETTLTSLDPEPVWDDETKLNNKGGRVFIKHLYGPLFFGFSSGFRALSEQIPEEAETLVVRMERVPHMDQSGLYTLEDTILQLTKNEKTTILTGLQTQPEAMMRRIGLIPDLIPEDRVFATFEEAGKYLESGKRRTEAAESDQAPR